MRPENQGRFSTDTASGTARDWCCIGKCRPDLCRVGGERLRLEPPSFCFEGGWLDQY